MFLFSPGTPGWREPLDCVRASELCNQNSQCSSRYRIMRQCLSGGDKERSAMLASKECQGALEVLQDSPLYDCRCKRGMKKELQCLQNYWSIHMGLTEGNLFNLSFISSLSADSSLTKMSPCSEAGKPCNPCLDAAKACNLNETCKRLRSAYNSICSKTTPPQPSALRQFFERVSWELSYPLLFCSCPDQACAERRRRTIVPSCSHQERHKASCLELRPGSCWPNYIMSRLADFHMNCQVTPHTVTTCPHDNYHGCLMSYVGLIGSDVTPNYSDSSPSNITMSLWCTCRGTGHQEHECEAFHRDFTHNTCLSECCMPDQEGQSCKVWSLTVDINGFFHSSFKPSVLSVQHWHPRKSDLCPLDADGLLSLVLWRWLFYVVPCACEVAVWSLQWSGHSSLHCTAYTTLLSLCLRVLSLG
uniref:GDNF family receptor alpha 2b n=1 Tax=Neolamprologus brichardi TaxID=32507 RepID=A0A3Q4GX33_NEOBR